jgi:hypothetical protein
VFGRIEIKNSLLNYCIYSIVTTKLQLLPNGKDNTYKFTPTATYTENEYILPVGKAYQIEDFIKCVGGTINYRIDISPGRDGIDGDTPAPAFIWLEKKATTAITTGNVSTATQITEVWARWVRIQFQTTVGTPVVNAFMIGIGHGG